MTPDQVKKAVAYNDKEAAEGDYTKEHQVRLIQFWQDAHDLSDDGWCGPITQKSIDSSIEVDWQRQVHVALENDDQYDSDKGLWLPWDGPAESQPKTYAEAIKYFGSPETSPGSDIMDKAWFKKNIIECHEKLGNRLPGVPAKWWVKINRIVEPYLREGLRRALLTSPYRISSLGGFVFRHIRHDPSKPLSMHALGCAFDVDPGRNAAHQYRKGDHVPEAWSVEWNKKWPKSVDRAFVQAMSSVGFAWGSDWDEDGKTSDHRWQDPMHFEWIARDGHSIQV